MEKLGEVRGFERSIKKTGRFKREFGQTQRSFFQMREVWENLVGVREDLREVLENRVKFGETRRSNRIWEK